MAEIKKAENVFQGRMDKVVKQGLEYQKLCEEWRQLRLKGTQLWNKTNRREMGIHMVQAVTAQIWPEERNNRERPRVNADMDDARMMVGKWSADWARSEKRRKELKELCRVG